MTGDRPQRPDVPAVLRVIDGGGQLLVCFELVRFVAKAIRVIQLHQILPQPAKLLLILRAQLLLRGQRLAVPSYSRSVRVFACSPPFAHGRHAEHDGLKTTGAKVWSPILRRIIFLSPVPSF